MPNQQSSKQVSSMRIVEPNLIREPLDGGAGQDSNASASIICEHLTAPILLCNVTGAPLLITPLVKVRWNTQLDKAFLHSPYWLAL